MENANRIELLAPPADWQPDATAAYLRFAARLSKKRRSLKQPRLAWAATAALLCVIVLVAPSSRVAAQQVWQWLTVRRVEVVRVDVDSLLAEAKSMQLQPLNKPAPPASARDIGEAAQIAGFTPRLPRPGSLSGAPQLSTQGPQSFGTTFRTADLELALRKAGVLDQAVPKQWDGAQIILQIGSTVTAAWPRPDLTLTQALPPKIVAPSGFDLGAFATAVLRGVGMSRETAQRFGQRMATEPMILMGIRPQDMVATREVMLRSGPATLFEGFGDRIELLWSVPDRVYLLSGDVTEEVVTSIANSVE